MKKFRVDTVLEVFGCVDVEAESYGEAFQKVAADPKKYADLSRWNDGAEAELRTYNNLDCIGQYELSGLVEALKRDGKEVQEE